jgi:hypothetical protein
MCIDCFENGQQLHIAIGQSCFDELQRTGWIVSHLFVVMCRCVSHRIMERWPAAFNNLWGYIHLDLYLYLSAPDVLSTTVCRGDPDVGHTVFVC